ncbi:CBS domain-containing protein [Paraburkholderia sp. J12]|uniref:CBS domain-containing protein n=1 Tax=Paraburkholderia sp. J12 TaxID=2805432 RepID=UPI002ABD9027|nr:CBS domain-containing protein [Paraburkholderia sp. J12]
MQVSDIMTTEVVTVLPTATVFEAAALMVKHHVSGLPVVDEDGNIVGLLSESDLLHRVETGTGKPQRSWFGEFVHSNRKLATQYLKEHASKVGDIMTENVVCVLPTASLAEVADTLERHRIKRVPVTTDGKLLGIVSRSNLVSALARAAQPGPEAIAADEAIRESVLHELDGRRWALSMQNVVVKDGVVHLWGLVNSEEERKAIRVCAERVAGVKGIEDHLGYPTYFAPM